MGWEAALGAIGGWAVLCVQSGVLGASMVLCTTPFYRLGQGRFALLSVRMYPRLHVSQKYILYRSILHTQQYNTLYICYIPYNTSSMNFLVVYWQEQ